MTTLNKNLVALTLLLLASVASLSAAQPLSCTPSTPRTDPGAGFVAFGAAEQLLARGGNAGPAWEWALGTDTDAGQMVKGSLDWVSGRAYSWSLSYSGTGAATVQVRDRGNLVLNITYPSGMDAGNALQFQVSTNSSIGATTTIAATVTSLNGQPVSGALSQTGNKQEAAQNLFYFYPPMSQGFTAQGTVTLTYASLPTGSRVEFKVRAGNVSCQVSNTPPTVSLTTNGATFKAPASVTLTAQASDSDGTVTQVDFFQGNTLVATVTPPMPFSFTVNNLAQGSYTFTAIATDDKGVATTSTPITVTVNSGVAQAYYIYTDQLNTPRVITDQTNKVVWRWDNQDPFGANVPDGDPNNTGNHFTFNPRFPGQYFDRETNIHYNYFRDYDPNIGRYIQSDPIGLYGGINEYTYVEANPISRSDRIGFWSQEAHNRIIDAAFSGLPRTFVNAIKQGSASVDVLGNQVPWIGDPAEHAMRNPGEPIEDAVKRYCAFIQANFAQFQKFQGNPNALTRLRAYRSLGRALHAITDSTSPAHQGFQEWHIYPDFVWHGSTPYSIEDKSALTPAVLAQTVNLINQLLSGSNPCPCAR